MWRVSVGVFDVSVKSMCTWMLLLRYCSALEACLSWERSSVDCIAAMMTVC